MARLRFRAIAERDLREIARYSEEQFGTEVADDYDHGLAEAFAQIANFPLSAPLRPEYGRRMRCKVYVSHRILYVTDKEGDVEIYRVIHHSRDARSALKP